MHTVVTLEWCNGKDADGDDGADDGDREKAVELDNEVDSDFRASVEAAQDEIELRMRGREESIAC